MTQMSESHTAPDTAPHGNSARSEARSSLARTVHDLGRLVWSLSVMAPTLAMVGCVIPPSLTIGEDAGTNSPPAILSVVGDQQALPEPGPVVFDVGRTAGTLSVSLIDTDITDTLYVRIFVNYNSPDRLDARVRCPPSSTGTAQRAVTCDLTTLCTDSDVGLQQNMTVVVFDRQPLEDGTDPAFQAMPAPGLSTSRFYFLKCQPRVQ
jgi:hypothetical protein